MYTCPLYLSCVHNYIMLVNPLDSKGNYSATANNATLVHWPLMGGLLHLVQRGGAWAGAAPPSPVLYCYRCPCNVYNRVATLISTLLIIITITITTTTTTTTIIIIMWSGLAPVQSCISLVSYFVRFLGF